MNRFCFRRIRTVCLFGACVLMVVVSGKATGQVIPVHAIGGSFSEKSDSIAVANSIDHYHRAALAIARRPPKGMIAFEIEKPRTTIYPNRDGTFDAVSNGLVKFMPFDLDKAFELEKASELEKPLEFEKAGQNTGPIHRVLFLMFPQLPAFETPEFNTNR